MATAKDCHVLTSYYEKKYKERYKTAPIVNKHSARWGFDSVLKGMSPEETKEIIDFFFSTDNNSRHDLNWFFYNYEKLMAVRRTQEEDKARLERLRQESEQRAQEWRERGNKRITND